PRSGEASVFNHPRCVWQQGVLNNDTSFNINRAGHTLDLTMSVKKVVDTELRTESGVGAEEPPASPREEHTALVGLDKFQRMNPTVFGAIQIAIGIFMTLIAIWFLASGLDFFEVAAVYWGIIIYIPAGAMVIATGKKLTKAMVSTEIVMMVLSIVLFIEAIVVVGFAVAALCSSKKVPDTSPTKSASFSPETWYRKAYEESSRGGMRPAPEGAGSMPSSTGTPSPGSGTSSPGSFSGSPGTVSPGIGTGSPGFSGRLPGLRHRLPGLGQRELPRQRARRLV
ncbi:hypothetical protein CRUP_009914, partial [Coryphaenoides rupestris]